MIQSDQVKKVLYGGDYNPEQWDNEIWKEDMRLFSLAHIDTVTINVFSWASIQKSEEEYDFSTLDEIVHLVTKHNLHICFATSTAAHPAWMARKYPDILRVNIDGVKRKFGGRHNSCPNSPTYRKFSALLAEKIAYRYGNNKNIAAWHVSNEYGEMCYCDNCEKAFRIWLEKRYTNIESLNTAWNTSFWGHTYYDWEDIVSPSHISEQWPHNRTSCQAQSIDYKRFMSDSLLECFKLEAKVLKKITPQIPVTTNFMGLYRDLDYHKWGKEMDFISWDNYPSPDHSYTRTAMSHAVMRGSKPGKPFVLMEQTPSVTNWQPYNALKRPGIMRLWSYQALAHGSDTVLFFQMRRSIGCCEKYHGAIIDHCGHEHTRVFQEAAELGKELEKIGDAFLGSIPQSRVAIIYDWDTLWATSFSAGPTIELDYTEEAGKYYTALARLNIGVDIIGCSESLDNYDIVIAPVLYMVKEGFAEKLEKFTERGGTFITGFLSGYVDERDLVVTGGYPGKLRKLCGLWVEEIDALLPGQENGFVINSGPLSGVYPAVMLCDIIHPETAETVAVYEKDFYKGSPSVCRNNFGKGSAWYIGASTPKNNSIFLEKLLLSLCSSMGIESEITPQEGVEAVCRKKDCTEFLFVLNHNAHSVTITTPCRCIDLISNRTYFEGQSVEIEKYGVVILEKISNRN